MWPFISVVSILNIDSENMNVERKSFRIWNISNASLNRYEKNSSECGRNSNAVLVRVRGIETKLRIGDYRVTFWSAVVADGGGWILNGTIFNRGRRSCSVGFIKCVFHGLSNCDFRMDGWSFSIVGFSVEISSWSGIMLWLHSPFSRVRVEVEVF